MPLPENGNLATLTGKQTFQECAFLTPADPRNVATYEHWSIGVRQRAVIDGLGVVGMTREA